MKKATIQSILFGSLYILFSGSASAYALQIAADSISSVPGTSETLKGEPQAHCLGERRGKLPADLVRFKECHK